MTDREVMQQALEALEDERYVTKYTHIVEAIIALRKALEQPEQQAEPVGSLSVRYHRGSKSMTNADFDYNGDLPEGDYELYTTPPAAQRKPLTEEIIWEIWHRMPKDGAITVTAFARAIEAAHGIKEET